MYSILKRVEQYIKDYGISFSSIMVSSNYFPETFNRVMLDKLNSVLLPDERQLFISNYIFSIDEDSQLKLIVYADKCPKCRIVMYPTKNDFNYDIQGKKISEEDIIKECQIRDDKAINELMCIARAKGLGSRINLRMVSLEDSLKETSKKCLAYLEYLNNYYMEMMRKNNEKSYIKYIKPSNNTIVRRTVIKGNNEQRERVNGLISIDDRINALESYEYLYSGYAYSNNKNDIEYITYLYQLNENNYFLIIEPYSGDRATITKYVYTEDGITIEEFNTIIKNILNLPVTALCKEEDIIRCYHTTFDTFKRLLDEQITQKKRRSKKLVKSNNI